MNAMWPSLALVAVLGGCSTTTIGLPYAATRATLPASGAGASVGKVTDARADNDATWVGAVRGGYGNPLKVLRTGPPVADVVRDAVTDGLRQRGLLAPAGAGRPELVVTVKRLDVSRYVRLDANVELLLQVSRSGGPVLYTDSAMVERVQGSILAIDTGVFAATDTLRDLLAKSLSEAIDQLLDKPALRIVLQGIAPTA